MDITLAISVLYFDFLATPCLLAENKINDYKYAGPLFWKCGYARQHVITCNRLPVTQF